MTEFLSSQENMIPSPLDIPTSLQFVTRLELWPKLLRRFEEEYIASLVPIDSEFIVENKSMLIGNSSLSEYLSEHLMSEADLDSNLHLTYALDQFAKFCFGPGLEEEYLSSEGGHDQVIYSLIRLKDAGIAQELWIRLEEGEASFPQLAEIYGQSPESDRKGLFGPLPIGGVKPSDLANLLRTLKPGEIHPPVFWGDWYVLIRLERLQSTPFDSSLRKHLLQVKLSALLDDRVNQRLTGQEPESLIFDPVL